jgi:hypothetical protein
MGGWRPDDALGGAAALSEAPMTPPRVGQRVELHPATDHWMRGDRYGVVTGVREDSTVDVALDKSRRIIRFRPDDILRVVEVWDGVARNVATARVLRGEDD